jgi:hypothetical protein
MNMFFTGILRALILSLLLIQAAFTQWQQTPGPRRSFATLASNEGILFAGMDSSGVYYSKNNGTTWSLVNAGWPSDKYVFRIVASGNTIYAAARTGIFRSAINSSEWVLINAGLPANPQVMSLEKYDTSIFVGVDEYGIYKSIDSGNSWSLLKNKGSDMVKFGDTIIVGAGYYALLSHDNGVTWDSVDCPFANLFRIRGDTLYAGTNVGLYRSLDKGSTWALVDSGMSNVMIYRLEFMGNDMFVGYGHGHAPVMGVFRSSNNGIDWTRINSGLTDSNISALTVIDTTIFVGTGEGVYRSANRGDSWTEIDSGLPKKVWNTWISSMVSAGPYIYAGTSRGMCISDDNGATWSIADSGLPANTYIQSLAVNGNTVFAGTRSNGIYTSTITDKIWHPVESGLPPGVWVWAIAVTDSVIIAGTNQNGMFRSLDNGLHWIAVTSVSDSASVRAFAIIGQKIFASIGMEGICLSNDNGVTWSPTSRIPVETTFDIIPTATMLFSNGTDLFAGLPSSPRGIKVGCGLYKSTDYGTTWEVTGKTGFTPCMAAYGDILFAGIPDQIPTINSVAVSSDGGMSWTDFSAGLVMSDANCLLVRDSYLILGRSTSLWRRPLSDVQAMEPRFVPPRMVSFDVRSSVMNNPSVLVSFSVPQTERIIITVYNINGQKKITLADGFFGKGRHHLSWDTRNLAPGFYVVKFQAGLTAYSKKCIVSR